MTHNEDIPFDFIEFVCRERQIERETAEELFQRFVRGFYSGDTPPPTVQGPGFLGARRPDVTTRSGGTPPCTVSFEPR